jgi:pimeloyl-ACP methyl ester carboxylesterase
MLIFLSRYQMQYQYDASKPTLVLVNSFTTSSELYQGQFANKGLTDKMNLLAIELLGHGKTRAKSDNFTYWDTAIMNLQAMEALGVKKAFVLGTSQGGWITVRMALLAPDRIDGIIPWARPWTTNLNARENLDVGMALPHVPAQSTNGQPPKRHPVSSRTKIIATSSSTLVSARIVIKPFETSGSRLFKETTREMTAVAVLVWLLST